MITSVPGEQAAAFGLLRRPQAASDRLPEAHWEHYGQGLMRRCGLSPALARRARTPLGNVWVIPGEGWVCLSLAGSPDPAALDDGGACANPTPDAVAGRLITWTGSRAGPGQMVHGLVSDATTEVVLIGADGSVIRPPIADNVYAADLRVALAGVQVDGETVLSLGVPGP